MSNVAFYHLSIHFFFNYTTLNKLSCNSCAEQVGQIYLCTILRWDIKHPCNIHCQFQLKTLKILGKFCLSVAELVDKQSSYLHFFQWIDGFMYSTSQWNPSILIDYIILKWVRIRQSKIITNVHPFFFCQIVLFSLMNKRKCCSTLC